MAKGAESKEKIINKLKEIYPDSFISIADSKILRIPFIENGERVEIKVALTAAKDCEGGDGMAPVSAFGDTPAAPKEIVVPEPTEEEKAKVAKLMEALNF